MSNKCQTQPNITRCTSSESFIFILCVICDWLQCPTALFAYVTILNNNNIKYRVGKKYQETDHQIFSIITKKSITQFWSSMLNYMQSLMMLITHDTTLTMAIKPPPTMFKCQHALLFAWADAYNSGMNARNAHNAAGSNHCTSEIN